MKAIAKKILALMLIPMLSVCLASCGDDDDEPAVGPGSGSGSSMTGWVEIDGTRYTFGNFYGGLDTFNGGYEFAATGFSRDPYTIGTGNYNMVGFSVPFDNHGNIYTDYLSSYFDIEVNIDCNEDNESGRVMYATYGYTDTSGITASSDGSRYVIDGRDVEVRYSSRGYITSTDPSTTISFHFEGVPTMMGYDEDYD